MPEDYEVCEESCFHYDELGFTPLGTGCSYLSISFDAVEKVKPGERYLHPKHGGDQFITISLLDLCNALAAGQSQDSSVEDITS